jgi:cytosine/adenosine deaminase-related metal-dependent hydrolase
MAAHAPYSVSPALFRAIAETSSDQPLTVHAGESPEEIEFLHSGRGPIRRMLEQLGVWDVTWEPPMSGPVDYLWGLGYLRRGTLVVHGVHLAERELDQLRRVGAVLVTCPRSNLWVGAGMPRVSHFYAAGVPVAIGTDSLASVASLNLFDELAELRRIAPDVAAASLLESATRVGAEALGFGASHGTIAAGKSASLVAVDVPAGVDDVEEYLVGGVPPSAVRRVP